MTDRGAHDERVAGNVTTAGTGTFVAGIGLLIGADTTGGQVVLVLAPALSVVLGWGVVYVRVSAARFLEERQAKHARQTLERAIANAGTSEERRARLRSRLEHLEDGLIDRALERVTVVAETPTPVDPQRTTGA
jgi:hypothetical protein